MTDTATPAQELSWDALFHLPPSPPSEELARGWDEIGRRNMWIKHAGDPAFAGRNIRVCASRYELRRWLEFANWSNGTGFALHADPADPESEVLCFIQMGTCSGEWMAIKSRRSTFKGRPVWLHVDFETISWDYILTGKRGGGEALFNSYLDAMFGASLDECRSGDYYKNVKR